MQAANSCDRIIGVCSLNDSIEIHLGFDRHENDGHFVDDDIEFLRHVVDGLFPFSWRFAFSHGALEKQNKLTKRERETLIHLLSGEPEKRISHLMQVTPKSIHQYVMRVYQKLGVTSRPQLMAKWMSFNCY